jgi:hypothetical protein
MIKPMRSMIVSLGVITACASQFGICAEKNKIDGWQAAKFGMTAAQILVAFPEATENTTLCKSPPPDLTEDCRVLLLNRYKTFGSERAVFFWEVCT